mgnify:CR=1 FL=1
MSYTLLSKTITSGSVASSISATILEVTDGLIQAKASNTGNIYIGDSTVTSSTGIKLGKPTADKTPDFMPLGVGGIPVNTVNLIKVYILVDNGGDGVNILYR